MSGNTGPADPDRTDRFAGDPAFGVHEGGKLSVVPTRSIDSIADLALTYQNVNIGQLLSGLRKSLAQPNEVSGSVTELGGQSWARVTWPRAAGRWSSWSAADPHKRIWLPS